MKKIGMATLLIVLGLFACTDGELQKEIEKLEGANTRISEEIDQQLQRYNDYLEQYNALRQEYDQNPNNLIGKDSVHTEIREQHNQLLKRHEELKEEAMKLTAPHDGIAKRHELDTYPPDSVRVDYKRMNADLLKARGYLSSRNNEIMQMLEEQQGMLQYITT
jgi:DNA gyrase/topoisomerase IV subunit A